MENNFEIDLSVGYLLVKMTANSPSFLHFYIEDNCLKSRSIYVKTYETQDCYLEWLSSIKVPNNYYLVEWSYEDENKVRKAIIEHNFSEELLFFSAAEFTAKLREEKINQILEDE